MEGHKQSLGGARPPCPPPVATALPPPHQLLRDNMRLKKSGNENAH